MTKPVKKLLTSDLRHQLQMFFMKIHLSFFLGLTVTIFLLSCSGKKNSTKKIETKVPVDSMHHAFNKPASGYTDTLRITSKSAVFFTLDSNQFKKLQQLLPDVEYQTEVHNCFYQMRNARNVLHQYWPTVKIIEATRVRYLLFIKNDQKNTCIDLDGKIDNCGIFLFDGKKEPEFIDMMNVDTALHFYFE